MKAGNKILIASQYLINDPPTRNTVKSFQDMGCKVLYVQQSLDVDMEGLPPGVCIRRIPLCEFKPAFLSRVVNLFIQWAYLNALIWRFRPDVLINIMFEPIALIHFFRNKTVKIACVLDIPPVAYLGLLGRKIYQTAVKNLKKYDAIWASDELKLIFIQETAGFAGNVFKVYNTPSINYFDSIEKQICRTWLQKKLQEKGANLNSGSMVMLRAGAVGIHGGIEETISAMAKLENVFFVLIGRPDTEYLERLKALIRMSQLEKKVFVFSSPSDSEWKMFLLGADLGHLIHTDPGDNSYYSAVLKLNSSLSNNRLFQYMAAGLPIISYQDDRLENLYKDVGCFFVLNTNDLENQIIELCCRLKTDERPKEQMSKKGQAAFHNKYNWEYQFSSILNHLQDRFKSSDCQI